MYRFVDRQKKFYKGIKRYHAIVEDKNTGKQYLTNRHFRRAVEADEYGHRVENKINSLLLEKFYREQAKLGGLIGSAEKVGSPAVIQTPAPVQV